MDEKVSAALAQVLLKMSLRIGRRSGAAPAGAELMATRIGRMIRAGELDNTTANSVQGWLHFWEQRHPVLLNLTGNGGRGLRGRRLRFRTTQQNGHQATARKARRLRNRIQSQQIGPVGRMRLAPSEASEQNSWRMRLQLEWFSQDGQIILDLWEPFVEFILRPALQTQPRGRTQGISNLLSVDGAVDLGEEKLNQANGVQSQPAYLGANDSYHQLLIDVASGERDVPLNSLFDPPLRLMPVDQLSDREIGKALRRVLARLARHGIAVDVCQHYGKRQTYRWLLEHILPRELAFPDLPRLGYVMHYLTSEHCAICQQNR